MKGQINKRLEALEQQQHTNKTGQSIERFTVDDQEYVQIYWNGKPMGKPMQAWMWDAWPHATIVKGDQHNGRHDD